MKKSIIKEEDVNTVLISMDKTSKWKVSKNIGLNNRISQLQLIACIEHFNQQIEECASCSSVNDVVTKIDSMPCHKDNVNFRILESIKMFPYQSENKLDISNRDY